MLEAILGVLAGFPKLLDLVESLAKQISTWVDNYKRASSLEDEAKAADQAKATKDTSDLENLFDPTNKPNP